MLRQKVWKTCWVAIPVGIIFLANSMNTWAAPVELSLHESIALALRNNPAVKIAEADQSQAVWAVAEIRGEFGPGLKYDHTYSRAEIAASTLNDDLLGYLSGSALKSNGFRNRITLNLPLYTGGRRAGLLGQAEDNLYAARLEVKKAKQQLAFDTTTAYFNALQARSLLEISQESMENLTAHLKNVQVKYEEGLVTKAEVLRAEVELANAGQDLMTAQNDYNLAIDSLNNVMGLPLDHEITITATGNGAIAYESDTRTLEECIQYARRNHPAVIQSQIRVNAAKQGVKAEKSGNLPQISLNGSNDWYDEDFPGAKESYWMVSLTASLNVFDAGVVKSKVKQAESKMDKARQQARQAEEAAALDVSKAYHDLRAAENRIATTKGVVDKAREIFRITEIRYREGAGTNLDVIDAQLTLAQAKTKHNQARYDYCRSKAKLMQAMGMDQDT
ncbi:TolC family protein [Acetonema longum]|uniref:Outer membrane efflux protein n=1 Tax=Acetonema longum DSM 6540 TaxID=1009370 RepID=F7NDT5_9FIRM|nr:TolC family protein [Acetonema longum]EGO65806.1 outer membrane efflux protein [Acetonema longum DSM 6540]